MIARNHHFLSQCYLKGFAQFPKKPKLYVTDIKERKTFSTHPENIAAIRDFHRIEVEGIRPDFLETELSKFETQLAEALSRIIAARSISNEADSIILLNFVALVAVKNPRWRQSMTRAYTQTAKIWMDMITATPQRWAASLKRARGEGYPDELADISYEEARKFVDEKQYEIAIPNNRHLRTELSAFETALQLLYKRRWLLLKAPPKATGFITSDHPMCLMWQRPRPGLSGPGLGLKDTQVIFPISNELAMVGTFEGQNGEMDAPATLIAATNGIIAAHAERQVYARDREFQYIVSGDGWTMKRGTGLLNDERFARSNASR
ncbi:DUF4238 domain-containing protein [Niveispirillum sp. KHB5.9]|uniref:DUF4238 domain-containing protein n=1 Tax=Niveispirillum sp. KHB5.9 TaxID=3400269 RepID=UPI003A85B96B